MEDDGDRVLDTAVFIFFHLLWDPNTCETHTHRGQLTPGEVKEERVLVWRAVRAVVVLFERWEGRLYYGCLSADVSVLVIGSGGSVSAGTGSTGGVAGRRWVCCV